MSYNAKDLALCYRKIQDSSPSPGFRQVHKIERFPGNQKDAAMAARYASRFSNQERYATTLAKQHKQRRAALSKAQPSLALPTTRGANARSAAIQAALAEVVIASRPAARQAPRYASPTGHASPTGRASTSGQTAKSRAEDLSWRQPAPPPPSLAELTRRLGKAAMKWLATGRSGLSSLFSWGLRRPNE